jgi:hypothetical protein
MLAACLLLLIATVSGALLTFLYDRAAPLPARLCMGASTGLALMAAIGFLLALWLGLSAACIGLTAAVMLLPVLLLLKKPFRALAASAIRSAATAASHALRHPKSRTSACLLVFFYSAMAILLGVVFGRAAYENSEGIFTGLRNNLGDLTLHLQVIFSFAQGHNFPPEDPTYAGVRFAYPFLVDFLTAMLVRVGADVFSAMWLENMVLALALVGMIHYWTLLLTRNCLAGLIAPVLVIFSGGLGWAWIFQEVHDSAGLIPLLAHLPHDYTILDTGPLRWGNSLTTLFVTQRSILLGMPLAICIFCLWWKSIAGTPQDAGRESSSWRRMTAAGLFAGLLPLTHAHTFLVVMGVGACLTVLFLRLWKDWLRFFVLAAIVALPQVLWLGRAGGVKLESYLAWQPGWDHGDLNPVLFWLLNTGLFIPLLLLGLLWRRPNFRLPKPLLTFYAPFMLCFIVPNLIRLAPSVWDNIKVLIYWYVASAPLVALVLALGLKQKSGWRWLSVTALAAMVLAGALDLLRVVAGETEYREFDREGIAIAKVISQQSSPRARVLHGPTYNTPVFLTGRRSLLGYPGWMWSRGLEYSQRQTEIERVYAGAPDAEELLRRYQVDYALIGPEELRSMHVSPQFWSRYSRVAQIGQYRLYRTGFSEERAPQ